MRRADRLYQITLFLRSRPLTTARWLADALNVSERTIYRDVADLMCTGLDIEGEAGVGYRLRQRDELPPLTFSTAELDALRLGCRLVSGRGDAELARAAKLALSRIELALKQSGHAMNATPLYVPPLDCQSGLPALPPLRDATRQERVVQFDYVRADGTPSTRRIHPLGLFYWESCWTLVAWCELRNDYRHFRLDRMQEVTVLAEHFPRVSGRNLADYLRREGIAPERLG